MRVYTSHARVLRAPTSLTYIACTAIHPRRFACTATGNQTNSNGDEAISNKELLKEKNEGEKTERETGNGFQRVRGMYDCMGEEKRKHDFIVRQAQSIASTYGYSAISTPIVEHSTLFQRSLGVGSDVVMKEMYCFEDLAGNKLTLRPENTASVARAVLDSNPTLIPQRFFYSGPFFRYESPQKGRSRQFHQIGVELLGLSHPHSDIECISLAWNLLSKLKVTEKIALEINTLGDEESRTRYKNVLSEYLQQHKDRLSNESVQRLNRGSVLRILDSKDSYDSAVIKEAPVFTEYLTPFSKQRLEQVMKGLETVGIPFTVNPRLVRGLDYYCHTIFEIVSTTDELGRQQGTVLAGGRYDGLMKALGGPDMPGLGWAAGIERLMMITPSELVPKPPRPIAIIAIRSREEESASEATLSALRLCHRLRASGFPVMYSVDGNVTKQTKKASREAVAAIIIGEDELKNNQYTVKNFDTGQQTLIHQDELESVCASYFAHTTPN